MLSELNIILYLFTVHNADITVLLLSGILNEFVLQPV